MRGRRRRRLERVGFFLRFVAWPGVAWRGVVPCSVGLCCVWLWCGDGDVDGGGGSGGRRVRICGRDCSRGGGLL